MALPRLETYLSQSRKQELRLHHRAILLWAQSLKSGWLTQKEIDSTIGRIGCTAETRWWLEYAFTR